MSPGSLTVYATTHSRLSVKSVHLLWTRDDWQSQSQVDFAAVGQEWDDLTWGWVFFWRAELPVSAGDLLRYKIFADWRMGAKSSRTIKAKRGSKRPNLLNG